MSGWLKVQGVVTHGFGVASRPSKAYPYGTIQRQIPVFAALGLDLSDCFPGTLNIDLSPCTFELAWAEITLRDVRWTDLHPPEHFSFSRCKVEHLRRRHPAWSYYPHPETKSRHVQPASVLEVLSARIPHVGAGMTVGVFVNPARVQIHTPGQGAGI